MTTKTSRSSRAARLAQATAAGALLIAGAAQADTHYTVIDLTALAGGTSGSASAINASGAVAGQIAMPNTANEQGFLYQGGLTQTIAPIGSTALGINASGQVVGNVFNPPFSTIPWQGYRYAGGTLTNISMAPGSQNGADTVGINNAGTIAGDVYKITRDGLGNVYAASSAAIYANGAWTSIGVVAGDWQAGSTGINSSGTVVGQSLGFDNVTHAFVYSNGTMQALAGLNPLSVGDTAIAINDAGVVAGSAATLTGGGHQHAVSWTDGVIRDLGTLGGTYGEADAINGAGVIVGDSAIADGTSHAFITAGGALVDLNSLLAGGSDFAYLSAATGINDLGQIVGTGMASDGQMHAFLLDPVAAVPEPASWALTVAGLACLGVRAQRRRTPR